MKHNSLFSANGLLHNPLASTTIKSSFLTAIFKPLLLLFLLVMGSSVVWADDYALNNPIGADGYYIVKWDCANSTWASSNSMQIGETFTFAIDITGNSYLLGIVNSGHTIAFAHYAGDGYEREYTADCFRLKQISGNIYGATYNFKKDKPDWDTQKIWARFWDGNNWDYPGKEIHSPTKYGLFEWATNTGATSPDFTSEQIAADGGMPNGHQRNGYAAPCACEETGGGGDSGPTKTNWSFRGDMWLNGDGGWLGGSDSKTPHFIDYGDGNVICSFVFPEAKCRITLSDNGTDKKSDRCDGVTNLTKSNFATSDGKYTFTRNSGVTGIKKYTFSLNTSTGRFTVAAGNYDVQKTGWHVYMSTGDGDPTEVGTITEEAGLVIPNVASGNHNLYITDGSATTIAGVNWFGGLYIDKNNSDVAWATQRVYYDSDKFSSTEFPIRGTKDATGRFKLNETSDIIVAFDGGKITINKAVAPDPSLQPWSGDSYRDWYLTGDFSNPGVFDAWVQNPSAYKFAADGDNHQKVSITLDPNDASIFHDNSGHKLTRFEIIRQGTWDDPRINKPQFHAATSNCSLQTDWKDAGSNRMSLELTAKSVIEFDIWRWGTAPGSADRKVTVTITPVPQVTVTFMANGETFATQTFDKGGKASIPAGTPARSGHNFNGWDWDFNTTVNENTTINAKWVYKAISSVVLNESTHMTWVGNSDFALTPTLTPSDLITKSVAWNSDVESVATVSGGTVHAVSAGSAIITCTVTDQFDTQLSASCEVTVAACQMIVNNLYSMTVTGYNSKTGDNADLSGLWNESSDNDGPASMTRCNIRVGNNNGSGDWYAYDNNGQVFADNDATHYWYLYASNSTVGSNPVYYVQDVSTGKYMYMTTTFPAGQSTVNNPDWVTYPIMTGDKVNNNDNYLWYAGTGSGSKGVIVCYNGSKKANVSAETDGKNSCIISRRHWTETWMWNNAPTHAVGASHGAHQGGGNYTDMQSAFVNVENIPNPNYKASLMNGSYYRMNTDATVQANLNAALVSGAVITVRLYADAATSVKLQKTDGTEIETIDLSADAELEYSYTVASNSALLGENAFVIKAADNHAGIASIVVTRTYAASPSDPALEWETDLSGGVTRSVLSGTFQHIASSTLSSGAIHYISSDETVATVAADGTVTPLVAGNTTITATIEEEGCYAEAYITYNVTLTEASLQEAIDATPGGGTLALTHDYNDNAKINKAITINGGNHTIGDLKIENTGDLTLSSGLIVRDFTICAKAGNTSIQAASGQVRNATNLTVNGNAYFLYTVDPNGHVQYGWYDFTVPFPVNAASGIKGIQDNDLNEDFVNERDYAIMEYLGERKALGQYPYQKFRGVMQPNQLYSITLDNRDNYNTVRFQKTADGALVAGDNVTLHAYAGSGAYNNLNGVGNGTLHHADAGNLSVGFVQVYQSGDKTFLTVDKNDYSFVVGTAFMVQEAGTMTLNQATHGQLLAPSRYESAPATAIQIAREGQPFSDQLFISASETGGQAYTPGTDLAKAGDLGSANVPQIWTTAYNNPLCVHEAQLINGEASYNLSIYAPAADTYTLTSRNIPADYSLYLTQNGTMLTELNGTYTLDLNKGITTEYGLLLVETYKTPTGIEESGIRSQESGIRKILHNGVLYILHNGKVYNAQGGKVCDL